MTLVPGNHDALHEPRRLEEGHAAGPLSEWSSASAMIIGQVVERGDVVFMPIDTSWLPVDRALGRSSHDGRSPRRSFAAPRPGLRYKSVVLVFHHPPFVNEKNAVWQWIDGLRGYGHAVDLMGKHPRMQILHGHLHKVVDSIVRLGKEHWRASKTWQGSSPRRLAAKAARPHLRRARGGRRRRGARRGRLYDVRDGALESAGFYST